MRQFLANLVGAGNVTTVDDTGPVQQMQVTEPAAGSGFGSRVLDKVLRIFQFGFTSVPPLGSQVVTLRRGGDRSITIVIGTNHQASRPTGLQPGDSAMYDVRGVIIKFTAAGPLIDCGGLPFVVQNTTGMHVKGALTVDDDVTALAASDPLAISTVRSTFNAHDHSGVTAGTGTSSTPTAEL
ncbi:phage baseplate assembly protein [Novosphingobium sp. FSW06-99]|uniref:phage baseplate assembly protein domain-containing protein n=1 Tax=Novosphingobium sp. FSW06-99 TaxID=1739113 RepID=UPI00076C036B|nr:phage baseplate assembly protein [Novosphingobium sp. FSW06-99]KUR80753.1 hypothetical protein AQZ49_01620 [Novosphingobium sp. FSW06-99]